MRALREVRLLAGLIVYVLVLGPAAAIGSWLGVLARRLDARLEVWRHELRPVDAVRLAVARVAYAIRHGVPCGAVDYDALGVHDMDRLARAIENLGCDATVWPRRAWWARHLRPTGERLELADLPSADRAAWADAIANLDGEA